jgi:hypothetical protein
LLDDDDDEDDDDEEENDENVGIGVVKSGRLVT